MKNIYIIALREGNEPVLIQQRVREDISYIGINYEKAYIAESKKQADETWRKWYKMREERKTDNNYPDFF